MADQVNGKDLVLYAKLGSSYYPFACAKDVTITQTADKIELAPYTSGRWRSYIPSRMTGTISGNGLVKIVGSSTQNSIFDLLDSMNEQEIILVKYSLTDPQGNEKVYEVPAIIDDITLSGIVGSTATWAFNLTINGDPSFEQTAVNPALTDVDSWDYTATGGETTISNSILIGVDVLDVRRNGIGLEVVFTGTPTGSQVKFTQGSGSLEFGFALGADEYILVIYVS
jgi:hypothetical protein